MARHGKPVTAAKVAVVVAQLGYGGAERQTTELLRRLRGTEWEPRLVVCLSDQSEPFGTVIRELGYQVVIVSRSRSFDPGRIWRLHRVLTGTRIDLVHSVNFLASGYAWLASKLGGRYILVPSVRRSAVPKGWIRRVVYRSLLSRSPVVLVNSHSGAHMLSRVFMVSAERVIVVNNGVDFGALRNGFSETCFRTSLGIDGEAAFIGFVGKDSHVKDVPSFMRVAELVLEKVPQAHIVLAGYGLDEAARENLAADLPKDRVHLLGPQPDIPQLLKQIDVLVVTSRSEGCPNVVLESLGVGTPVVGVDVGDISRIIATQDAGAVVARGGWDEMAEAVAEILIHRHEARKRVEREWPRLESEYSIDKMVADTVGAWKRVLHTSPKYLHVSGSQGG